MKIPTLLLAALLLISCKGPSESETEAKTPTATPPEGTIVTIETSLGTIKARLHDDTAPLTVTNFLGYVDDQYYDHTIFHRVISNFMIQGGGFEIKESTAKEKETKDPIRNESQNTRKNTRGTLAMARTPDPHSATSQFFISVQDNANLDYPNHGGGYAVFGEVIEGMKIIDQIKDVPVGTTFMNSLGPNGRLTTGSHENVPVEPIFIKSIRRASPAQ